jgi:Spy/CpxP family protein refolding chaperone
MLLVTGVALAQQAQAPPAVGGRAGARVKGEAACFQKAGVSDSVWQQVHSIRQNTHKQVAAICQNASATPEQKRQQIKQAHKQAKQQVDALLTPQQLAGIKECREERHAEHASGGKTGGKGGQGDSCAAVRGGTKGKSQ